MSCYLFNDNSFSDIQNEENDYSDLNGYNHQGSQSSTNKFDIYKSDSNSYDANTIDELIKKEFMQEKMEDNLSEDDSLFISRYQIKKEVLLKGLGDRTGEGYSQKRIFDIQKVPKNEKNLSNTNSSKKPVNNEEIGHKRKRNSINWESIVVPKEKHFHFDRKKHRIVFQRKHLKVIYSIVDLSYPFNFKKYYEMIKEHIGDKTNQNYGKGKSFHFVKVGNEEKIVTLKEKKTLIKSLKNKKNSSLKESSNKKEENNQK